MTYTIIVTQEQLNKFVQLLDVELKTSGLKSLALVVELNNLLVEASQRGEQKQ